MGLRTGGASPTLQEQLQEQQRMKVQNQSDLLTQIQAQRLKEESRSDLLSGVKALVDPLVGNRTVQSATPAKSVLADFSTGLTEKKLTPAQEMAQEFKVNKRFSEMWDKVRNPSSRRLMGRYQLNIDRADAIGKMVDHWGNTVKAFDKIPSNLVSEIEIALTNLISQSVPTQFQMEEIKSESWWRKLTEEYQKLRNNPTGAGAGKFVEQMLSVVKREKEVNDQKKLEVLKGASAGFSDLEKEDPDRFYKILGENSKGDVSGFIDDEKKKVIEGSILGKYDKSLSAPPVVPSLAPANSKPKEIPKKTFIQNIVNKGKKEVKSVVSDIMQKVE